MGDDPPYLMVGTEVSAKYRGAFCEAKIRKVVRIVKCKVTFKAGLGTTTLSDDLIKGDLRVGAVVEAKHQVKNAFFEATINKIQDCSQYTVVFDDGDITTLRRSALCLKSGRHFNESETLDQLPLTHPEHFSNPVVGGRRGVRRRVPNNDNNENESSDEEDLPAKKGRKKGGIEADMGKVVCVESSDKKKTKDYWFPALIVSPSAQETVKIRTKDEYLVRSFKDGRYYTVPKKEITGFTKETCQKSEHSSSLLRSACDKAVQYLERNELPPHWDRDVLFGHVSSSNSEDAVSESEMSEDDPREDKDRFVAQLFKFMDERQTPINKVPTVCGRDLDLFKLYKIVTSKGGYNKVTNASQWKPVTMKLGYGNIPSTATINLIKQSYKKILHNFEEFNRKLGCSLTSLSSRPPTSSSGKARSNRSLIRERPGSAAQKEMKKSEERPKVELFFGPASPSDDNVGSDDLGDAESESVTSETGIKVRETSPERQEEPRRSRSRLDSRSNKKDSDDSSDKAEKPVVKQKRISKKKDSVTATEPKEKECDEMPPAVPASPSPVPSSTGSKRGRSKLKKKDLDLSIEKDAEIKSDPEESPDHIGKGVKVTLGDKVQVYYGPKSKGKVTYNAKIVDTRVKEGIPEYLVHYTGWNTRYDEWITRNRIAFITGSGTSKSSNDSGKDNDNDSTGSKSTPKITPKRKGRPAGPGSGKGKSVGKKQSMKEDSKKGDGEDQSGTDSDGDSSDSDEKQQISTPPSSVGSSASLPQGARSSRSKRPNEEDDASSVSSSVSNSLPASKASKMDLDDEYSAAVKSEPSVVDSLKTDSKTEKIKSSSATSEVKASSSTGEKATIPTSGVTDVKLDIYEFQEDFNEAPGLKMYSPRSPDKKEDNHGPKPGTSDTSDKSTTSASEEAEVVLVDAVGSKIVQSGPVVVKEEPPKGVAKESKPKKDVKKDAKASQKLGEAQDNVVKKSPSKKVSTKVWNPATVAPTSAVTTVPVSLNVTTTVKPVGTSGTTVASPSVQSVPRISAPTKTQVLQPPITQQRPRASVASSPPALVPSVVNVSPISPMVQPRPPVVLSPPISSLIRTPTVTVSSSGTLLQTTTPVVQSLRTSTVETPTASLTPVVLHAGTAMMTSSPSAVSPAANQPSIVIRPAGDAKHVFHPRHTDAFSPTGSVATSGSLSASNMTNSGMPPITVVTPSGQIIHSPHTPISTGIIESVKSPVTYMTPSQTIVSSGPSTSVTTYSTTPTKKSPLKRKAPQSPQSVSSGSSLAKIDPTHLPPKKKVKKVITKNIIDVHMDETKEPLPASPEKKIRKPAKKRIKQDGLLDFDRPGFVKSPSKSPKKKKPDNPANSSIALKGISGPTSFSPTATSLTFSTLSSGTAGNVPSVLGTASSLTYPLSAYDKSSSPVELHLAGTIRGETSTGPKIDVKLVKCSSVSGIRIPDKKYGPQKISEPVTRIEPSKGPQDGKPSSTEERVPMTRIYPYKPGQYEYITISASEIGSNSPNSVLTPITASSSAPQLPTIHRSPAVIHSSASSMDARIVAESENRDVTVSAYSGLQVSEKYSFKDDSAAKSEVKPVTIVPITREIRPDGTTVMTTASTGFVSTAPVVIKTEVKQEPLVSVTSASALNLLSVKPEETTAKVNVVSIKVSSERPISDGKILDDPGSAIPVVSIKEVDLSGRELDTVPIKDEEESCHSLLCEEIIPGSPPPGTDSNLFGVDDENSRLHSPVTNESSVTKQTDSKKQTVESKADLTNSTIKTSFGNSFVLRPDSADKGPIEKPSQKSTPTAGASGSGEAGKTKDSFARGFLEGFRQGAQEAYPPSSRQNESSARSGPVNRPSPNHNPNHAPAAGFDGRLPHQSLQNVIDNTPPTTPESSSLSSGSPRVDGGRVSPSHDLPSSSKSKDSSDIDSGDAKRDEANEEESSSDAGRKSGKDTSPSKKADHNRMSRTLSPPGKRKRIQRKRSPDEVVRSYSNYRNRTSSSRKPNEKESDHGKVSTPVPPINLVKPPVSKKFNLIPELDDGMDADHRIQVLQQALQSIRDKYHEVKAELSSEERRLKRYKRRQKEREKEKCKQVQKAA